MHFETPHFERQLSYMQWIYIGFHTGSAQGSARIPSQAQACTSWSISVNILRLRSEIPSLHYLSINSVRTNGPTLCPIIFMASIRSQRGFSTYSGAYGSHTIGHSVEPLAHCYIDSDFHLKIQPIWDRAEPCSHRRLSSGLSGLSHWAPLSSGMSYMPKLKSVCSFVWPG